MFSEKRPGFHSNGGNRVLALEILSEPPLCIVGVYMPVRATSKNFQEVLDKIAEIIQTFRSSHGLFVPEYTTKGSQEEY